MLKKHNIFLFIILILLICFCLFNRTLMENLDNSDTKNLDCSKSTLLTFSGKSKNKNNADHPNAKLLTAKKTAEKNNCGLGTSSSDLPGIINDIKNKSK